MSSKMRLVGEKICSSIEMENPGEVSQILRT